MYPVTNVVIEEVFEASSDVVESVGEASNVTSTVINYDALNVSTAINDVIFPSDSTVTVVHEATPDPAPCGSSASLCSLFIIVCPTVSTIQFKLLMFTAPV